MLFQMFLTVMPTATQQIVVVVTPWVKIIAKRTSIVR
jgi:hypothetical protein